VLDADTQRYVTDSLPKVRLRSLARAHGTSTPAANPLLLGASQSARLVSEEGELFPAALLGQLPNLHYLAVLSGGRVVKGRLPFLTPESGPLRSVPDRAGAAQAGGPPASPGARTRTAAST
jgi:conjugal transfer pilus assembly protein TraD